MNKPTATIAAFMFAVALSVSPTGVRAASGDEASIRALESRFVAAVNAKDVNAIMKVYLPDESLFVFDNVESLESISDLLPPPNSRCHVILTSRTEQPGFERVAIDLLSLQDSLKLLSA